MTTEIAVSNRLGIALATDSAVTITGGGRVKIFDTADKLFELSAQHPVAVMFNGNMDCLGVPWEILVKDFRAAEGHVERPTVAEWARDFLRYVEGHGLVSEQTVGGYIDNVSHREMEAVQNRVGLKMRNYILSRPGVEKFDSKKFDIRRVLLESIEERQQFLYQFPVASSLEKTSRQKIHDAYSDKISKDIEETFSGDQLSEEEVAGLINIVIEALLRANPSDFAAGVIVAGYGSGEMFPSLCAVEIDGRVAGHLKITDSTDKMIAKAPDKGQVVYLAQTDVIERSLKGVDPEFVEKTTEFIRKAVTQVAESIETALRTKKMPKSQIEPRKALVKEVADTVANEFNSETVEMLKCPSGEFLNQVNQL